MPNASRRCRQRRGLRGEACLPREFFITGRHRINPFPASPPMRRRPLGSNARQLRPSSDLRPPRVWADRGIGDPQLRPRPVQAAPQEARALRVGHHSGHPSGAAPVGSLLPDGDALHHLRRRGGLLLSVGRPPAPAEVVWPDRDACLHRHPGHRPRPYLAQGRPGLGIEALAESLGQNFLTTTLGKLVGWGRGNSVWPAQFGLACCAIEMIATATAGVDIGRFGSEAFRASPRQSDLMIVSGRVSQKMAPILRTIYDQMPEPKWVMSMGACASTGGVFNNYALLQGVDKIVPVDVYIPGCPPRPEDLLNALMILQERIKAQGILPRQ